MKCIYLFIFIIIIIIIFGERNGMYLGNEWKGKEKKLMKLSNLVWIF